MINGTDVELSIPCVLLKYNRSGLIIYYIIIIKINKICYKRLYRFKELEHIYKDIPDKYKYEDKLEGFSLKSLFQVTNSLFSLIEERRIHLESLFKKMIDKHFNIVFLYLIKLNDSTYTLSKYHNGHLIIRTVWALDMSLNNKYLIELPWARQCFNVNECQIDTTKKEYIDIVRTRFYEFKTISKVDKYKWR